MPDDNHQESGYSPDNNKLAVAVLSACMVLSVVFSILRLYSRVFCAGRVKLEDYMGVLGFVFYIAGACVLARIISSAGFFVPVGSLLGSGNYESFVYGFVVTSSLWCFAFVFLKGAIIVEWTHVLNPRRSSRNWFFWACYILLFTNVCLYMATFLTIILSCTPRERSWRPWIPGSCIDKDAFNIAICASHLFLDIILSLLPHKVIWKLSMSIHQKIGVSVVFSVGVILCACAGGRVASAVLMSIDEDKSYAYSRHLLWGVGEATSSLLVFCAPSIPIILNGGSRTSRLKTSAAWAAGQRRRPSEHRQRPWPRIASNSTTVEEYHRMNEDNATQLTRFGQSDYQTASIHREEEQHPLQVYLGILKTTEIEVTTHTETDPPTTRHTEEEMRHPWTTIQSSS